MSDNRTMTVKSIDRQGDRTLFYGDDEEYHIIADADVDVAEGDVIEYEHVPCSNFGWFVQKITE